MGPTYIMTEGMRLDGLPKVVKVYSVGQSKHGVDWESYNQNQNFLNFQSHNGYLSNISRKYFHKDSLI